MAKNKSVYLAGAIDKATLTQAHAWRYTITRFLLNRGWTVFNPSTAFGSVGHLESIQVINNAVIKQCGVLAIELHHDCEHVGTLLELELARSLGIPCFVWVSPKFLDHVSLHQKGIYLYQELGDMMNALVKWGESEITDTNTIIQVTRENSDNNFPIPSKAYVGDAGFDLPAAKSVIVPPSAFCDVPMAFRLTPPPHIWLRIVGRSSTLRKHGLLVNEGIIDSGWRGPLFAGVWNMTAEPVTIEAGQRICQVIPQKVYPELGLVEVAMDNRRHGDRGENGFGSTGQ